MGLSNGLMLTDTAVRDENGEEKHDTLTFSQIFLPGLRYQRG